MAKGYKKNRTQAPGNMLGQLQKLQEQMQQVQEQLAQETVTASAGGGVVQITVTGEQVCTKVEIAPEILEDADIEMLQDLILTAFNSAVEKSRQLAEERLGPLTGGLGAGLPF
jgi:nucleoid-associated protein EbfC